MPITGIFVVTAIRDAPEGSEAAYEVHGKIDVSDPVTLDLVGDIGRQFVVELTPLEEPTPDTEPEGEPIE